MVRSFRHLFTPHYSNNHRPRILHPVGLAVLTGILVLTQVWTRLVAVASVPLPQGMVLGFASNISADQVVELTNSERAKAGLSPLSTNGKLSQAAAAKASHMFANNYWAHVAPDGTSPWYFITNAGYGYSVAGENLARDFGDTHSMMGAWMNSSSHKDNIVNAKYSEIGVAVVDGVLEGMETTLVVQLFGTPINKVAATTTTSAASQTPQEARTPTSPPPSPTVIAAEPTPLVAVAQVIPTPLVTPLPVDERELAALGAAVIEMPRAQSLNLISPLMITKAVGVSLLMLLVAVLFYDEFAAHKHKLPRRVGKNWAHLALFSVVMVVIVAISQGQVL